MDFGIAKALIAASADTLTRTGFIWELRPI